MYKVNIGRTWYEGKYKYFAVGSERVYNFKTVPTLNTFGQWVMSGEEVYTTEVVGQVDRNNLTVDRFKVYLGEAIMVKQTAITQEQKVEIVKEWISMMEQLADDDYRTNYYTPYITLNSLSDTLSGKACVDFVYNSYANMVDREQAQYKEQLLKDLEDAKQRVLELEKELGGL